MSVTVKDLLELPCLRESEVLAGHGGLYKIVASISVLEYADVNSLQDDLFNNNEFSGGEIVISGLINVKDNVEAQLANIRRMAQVGEVGLILYYVGIFMPSVDKRLIDLANELDFVLICMPKNRMNLRYSEAISEVMEAIFKDQNTNIYFANEILERVSHLPRGQRNIETVLRMVSDRLHISLFLTDLSFNVLNFVAWPRTLDLNLDEIIEQLDSALPSEPTQIRLHETDAWLHQMPLIWNEKTQMHLFIIKENYPLSTNLLRHTNELVKLSVNIWNSKHSEFVMSELVQAILNDEPMNMRRLANYFKIDVASINKMWIIQPSKRMSEGDNEKLIQNQILEIAKSILKNRCRTLIIDVYDGSIIVFLDKQLAIENSSALANELEDTLAQSEIDAMLVACYNMETTTDVRQAYLSVSKHIENAKKIFFHKKQLTLHEILFAEACSELIASGEDAIKRKLKDIELLTTNEENRQTELLTTLEVFLLEANSNIAKTAELMFLHKNTIKYRIRCINERLCYPVTKMPEANDLYLACAIKRMLES